MAATIHDVARNAQVSIATVSRVLAGNYPVAAATRERVLASVEALNYAANPNARRLRGAAPNPVAVLLGSITGPSFAALAQGVEHEARMLDRICLIGVTGGDAERELDLMEAMRRQQASAIILPGGYWHSEEHRARMEQYAELLSREGSRLVLAGNRALTHSDSYISIRYDNHGGARRVAEKLTAAGHRSALILPGTLVSDTAVERLDAFRKAFEQHPDAELLVRETAGFDREPAKLALAQILDELVPQGGLPPFTAIICGTDQMAAGVLEAMRERSLRCPTDISVTGFDDIPSARDLNPALTTVRVPYEEMGARAVQMALTADNTGTESRSAFLPTQIIERASIAPPRLPTLARTGE